MDLYSRSLECRISEERKERDVHINRGDNFIVGGAIKIDIYDKILITNEAIFKLVHFTNKYSLKLQFLQYCSQRHG